MQYTLTQWRLPKRYLLVVMVFIGYMNFYVLHANIAMAVVDMTSMKTFSYENGTTGQASEYTWGPQQKALVLGSFSYGRLIGPIGGVLASRFGGGTMYGINTLSTALITIFSPLLLHLNFYLFVLATALTGTCESFAYASVSQLWSRWSPPEERAKFISISVVGIYAGTIVSYLVAGWILSTWKWPTLFYTCGAVSFLWALVWYLVVSNDPSVDKHISDKERSFIKDKLNSVAHNEKVIYPWKLILTCIPFWIVCICKFCNGLGYTFCMMYLPQYIKDMNEIDIKKIGYISVIPMLGSVISLPMGGCIFDYIRSNKIMSLTKSHKLFICITFFTGTVCFLVAGLWPDFIACVICITVFQFFSTFAVLDIQVLVLDLAPRYAAFMNATANAFFTVAGFLTPIFVSFIVTDHSQSQWSICFITFSVIFTIIALISLKFTSGELQPWADYIPDAKKNHSSFGKGPPKYSDCT